MVKTAKRSKTQLQQISDVAWLVRQGNNRLGILNKNNQEHFFYINGKETIEFDEETQVASHFGNVNLFKEQNTDPMSKDETFFIKGHVIDYSTPYPVDEGHPDFNPNVPLYAKTAESDVYYAAGWYCINFDKGWKHAYCPKYSTLLNYGYTGPFKTQIECKQSLKSLNRLQKTK